MAETLPRAIHTLGASCAALGLLLSGGLVQAAPASEPSSSVGEDSDPKVRAKVKLELGTDLYEQGRYQEALAAFQDAASLYASPDFQFNIGLCHERLGNYEAAISSFETYLRNKPDAPDSPSVRDRVYDLKERIELKRRASERPPVTSDVRAPNEPASDTVVAMPIDEPAADPSRGRGLVIGGAVLLGVGGTAAAAGGVALGVLAQRPSNAVDDVLDGGNPQERTLAETRELAERADRLRTGQIVALAGGGVLATVGLTMVLVGQRQRRTAGAARVQIGPSLTGLVVRGSF